jgi:hypothetical protein
MRTLLAMLAVFAACDPLPPPRPPEVRAQQDAPALAALRAGRFSDATREATAQLAHDPTDARLAAVRAVATYVDAADALTVDLRRVMASADAVHYFDHEQGRAIWTRFLGQLDAVDRDLAVAAADPQFSLELCIACWTERDWNHNGRIDDGDRHLFEMETDASGSDIPEGDPRRRPTFRFDIGDVQWARAMVSFQRAGAELVLAYRWSELDKLFLGKWHDGDGQRIVIHLVDADRVKRARTEILAGLDFSAKERAAYLAETDDDREWVPNPRQKSHAMPLAVDDSLYQRWADILGDAHHLLDSDDGISVREVAHAIDKRLAAIVPDAYVDVGRMLRDPQDIVIDMTLDENPATVERVIRGLFGHGYVDKMRPSPLVGRLRLMADDINSGDDTIDHKLHYLFWLN